VSLPQLDCAGAPAGGIPLTGYAVTSGSLARDHQTRHEVGPAVLPHLIPVIDGVVSVLIEGTVCDLD
jgi:hypothetical protein